MKKKLWKSKTAEAMYQLAKEAWLSGDEVEACRKEQIANETEASYLRAEEPIIRERGRSFH